MVHYYPAGGMLLCGWLSERAGPWRGQHSGELSADFYYILCSHEHPALGAPTGSAVASLLALRRTDCGQTTGPMELTAGGECRNRRILLDRPDDGQILDFGASCEAYSKC